MAKDIDITGKTFGRLTAVRLSHRDKRYQQHWEFLCSCGNTKIIRKGCVTTGDSKSCGCLMSEIVRKKSITHGRSRIGDRTYISWAGIISRVKHQLTNSYVGATVSEEWKVFDNFLRDMGERPEGKSIDRIDATKGYKKENCRWANTQDQARNRRKYLTKKTSSKYKGVCFVKKSKVWCSNICTGGKRQYIGSYKTQEEAALAYNEAAKKYHGEFACLNPI